jgi:signal transduction histidine kinase
MRRPLAFEQKIACLFAAAFFFIPAAPVLALPLPPRDRAAALSLLPLSFLLSVHLLYHAARHSLRRQSPLVPALILIISLGQVSLLRRHFLSIDLLLFTVTAGVGALWGIRPGLFVGVTAAAAHSVASLATGAGEAFSAALFALQLLFVGGLVGALSTHAQQCRVQAESLREQGARLAAPAAAPPRWRQEEFYETLTHALKSPLGTMVSGLLILRDLLPPEPPALRQALDAALQAGERQQALIENLRDWQRLREGALSLRFERVELGEIVSPLVESFTPRLERKAISFEMRLGEPLPAVRADRALLGRVLAHLLESLHKFALPHGRLTLSAEAESGRVRVTLSDAGPAALEASRSAVIETYQQVLRGEAEARDGLGLGLAFCQAVLRAHGGQLSLSASPAGDFQFTLALPLAPPA